MELTTNRAGLVFLGDIHGDWKVIESFCDKATDFAILQLGDFGIGFRHKIKDTHNLEKLSKKLKETNNELYIIRGNHDDPSWFKGNSSIERITFLQDYTLLRFQDKRIFCVGGGISIDRSQRLPGKSYWEGEEVVFSPEKVQQCDILCTHVPPSKFPLTKAETNPMVTSFHKAEVMLGGDLLEDLEREKNGVQRISDLSGCRHHYFGHFHVSERHEESGREYRCLDINEFLELRNNPN